MKILLVYPYFIDTRLDAKDIEAPPMGLYYVAAVLRENGYDVKIVNWHGIGRHAAVIEEVLRAKRPRVIGFSILHANRWGGIDIARTAKRLDPAVVTVFGGVGATHLWRHLLTHFPAVDHIVLGEGEAAFLKLVRAVEAGAREAVGAIPGVATRSGGKPRRTPSAAVAADLDQLPMPARHFDVQHLSLTRGCPSACSFCGSPAFWGRRVRSHSADYFVSQMEALKRRGQQLFFVGDDTFTHDRRRVIEVCQKIIARRLDVAWTAVSRVDAVDAEVLAWMRRAGCIQVSYGVESGSAEIRRRLRKTFSEKNVREAFAQTQRHGMMARAYFIYGCPGESEETIQQSIDLMAAIKPLAAVFYILDIFPGTALYTGMKRRLAATDDIWLERIEDIMYFETDPSLSAERVMGFGRRLRESFFRGLPAFVAALDPIADPAFRGLHADFFSRLALTFHQGDYARVADIEDTPRLAETLYRRALGYGPHPRAFLGLAMLRQAEGRHAESLEILAAGREHFPREASLLICAAVGWMNLGRFRRALGLLRRCAGQPDAERLAQACRAAMDRR
jgi:radical SAM superfamily enzyme YgiQ (UPF0313 family)